MTARGLILTLGIALSRVALADQKGDENKDLDLIPPAAQAPSAPSADASIAAAPTRKIYLENATTQSWLRGGIVAVPPPPPSEWQERLLLDVRDQWRLGRDVSLTYSGRLNARAQDGRRPQKPNVMPPRAQTALQHGGVNLHAVLAVRHIVADQ